MASKSRDYSYKIDDVEMINQSRPEVEDFDFDDEPAEFDGE